MRKIVLSLSVLLAVASILFVSTFAVYHHIKGDELNAYYRFFKKDGKKSEFNYWGLLSPIQFESQKITSDTMRFSHKVVYPLAPHFTCINPKDTSAESTVAKEIAKVISDSLQKIQFNLNFDYDRQSMAVRNHLNPKIISTKPMIINLSLLGTSSPEALKYGFEQSLQPDNIEQENCNLAKQRLDRTVLLLKTNLSSFGIKSKINNLDYEELQFTQKSDVQRAIKDRSLLDGMRYVIADVKIPTQKIEVTPVTAPILLPLWLLLILPLLRLKTRKLPKVGSLPNIDSLLWILTFIILTICIIMLLALLIVKYTPLILLMLLVLALTLLFYLIYLIWKNRKEIWRFLVEFWDFIRMLIILFFSLLFLFCAGIANLIFDFIMGAIAVILIALFFIISSIIDALMNFWHWYIGRPICQRILMVNFILELIALITWLMGLWHICF